MENGNISEQSNMPKSKKTLLIALIGIVAVAIVVCFIIITKSNSLTGRYQRQLELGLHYLEELEYEQAIAAFEKAIDIEPKNVDAYMGLADVYLAMDDVEKAIEILQLGYEKTEDDIFTNRIAELNTIYKDTAGNNAQNNSDLTSASNADDGIQEEISDEIREKISRHYVDGVLHNPYDIIQFDEQDTEILDKIINECTSGQVKSATMLLLEDSWKSLAINYLMLDVQSENDISRNFYYKGYKIRTTVLDSESLNRYMMLIPVNDGMGYILGVNHRTGSDGKDKNFIGFGELECLDGMFNGRFHIDSGSADDEWFSYCEGSMKNGLLDGEYIQTTGWHGNEDFFEFDYVTAEFSEGRPLTGHIDTNGKYTIFIDGAGTSTNNLDNELFYIDSYAWTCRTPFVSEEGVSVYSY